MTLQCDGEINSGEWYLQLAVVQKRRLSLHLFNKSLHFWFGKVSCNSYMTRTSAAMWDITYAKHAYTGHVFPETSRSTQSVSPLPWSQCPRFVGETGYEFWSKRAAMGAPCALRRLKWSPSLTLRNQSLVSSNKHTAHSEGHANARSAQ